jgi:hypothetical protein
VRSLVLCQLLQEEEEILLIADLLRLNVLEDHAHIAIEEGPEEGGAEEE